MSDRALLKSIGGEVQSRRKACGMSQEDVAELAGAHHNTVGRIERGEADPSVVSLSYLYFLLECSGVHVDRSGVIPFCMPGVSFSSASAPEIAGMSPAEMVHRLGTVVRGRRSAMGMSLRQLARSSGIHANSLWNLETGLVSPAITTYYRALRAMEVSRVTLQDGVPLLQ